MGRSKGVTISVKIPIKWESMTDRSKQRLRQIVGRDTRAIRSYLGIIEHHEDELLTGRNKVRINQNALQKLTLTALKVKTGESQRTAVPHDLKSQFPRISQNELVECRQTAVAVYESYLRLRTKKGRDASRPCAVSSTRRMPRWTFAPRFKLIQDENHTANWWFDLRDSLDSVPQGRTYHDRLMIPLKVSPFHCNQLERGEIKAAQIFTDRHGKWWVSIAIREESPDLPDSGLPLAVLGIDLGIEKAACTTLVTPEKVRETRYFVQKDKVQLIKRYDERVAILQREMALRRQERRRYDGIASKLKGMRTKRENISKEYDKVLVRQILDYIIELSQKYTLHIALGRLKNIRIRAQKKSGKSRTFRGLIHSWAFARITDSMKHQLAQLGWIVDGKDSRFKVIPESWTSIICWKCGSKGNRPKQNFFSCPTCGHKTNADRNGSINIAGRLITLTKSLHNVRGLGKWASAVARSRLPKTQGKSSRRKSLLSSKSHVSDSGESAVVHSVQMDLLSFGNESEMYDDDPAVESTVETLTVAGDDTPASGQEKETGSVGGIPSR